MYFSIKKVVPPFFATVIWPDKAQNLYIRSVSPPPSDYLRQKQMKTHHASSGILDINYKSPPCLTYILPNKLKINPLPHHQD